MINWKVSMVKYRKNRKLFLSLISDHSLQINQKNIFKLEQISQFMLSDVRH